MANVVVWLRESMFLTSDVILPFNEKLALADKIYQHLLT